jgi:dTDP-4-dehydrorhamnose 3,5-epimerase
MFEKKPTPIPGCFEIQPRVFDDERGRFVKVFHEDAFRQLDLHTDFAEEYYSVSRRGVIRGLHFQTPPMDHVKLVYCTHGEVLDVVLDLRVGSPTFGQVATFTLSASKGNYVYLPKGLAHGFCVLSETATLVYKVSTVYAAEHDSGVLWNSIDLDWPTHNPILSERDRSFKPFSEFDSPFVYEH